MLDVVWKQFEAYEQELTPTAKAALAAADLPGLVHLRLSRGSMSPAALGIKVAHLRRLEVWALGSGDCCSARSVAVLVDSELPLLEELEFSNVEVRAARRSSAGDWLELV